MIASTIKTENQRESHFESSLIINGLPLHLLDEILFRLEPKSLAMMQCVSKFIKSHIYDDPNFEIGYSFRVKSSLFNLGRYGANHIFCQPFISTCDVGSVGRETRMFAQPCYIFGSCSGLLLLYIDALFVANPLTKRFRLLDHSGSNIIPHVVSGDGDVWQNKPEGNIARTERAMCIGFVVHRYQNTTKFKIVCILETESAMYRFEISDGDFWRLSATTITTRSKSDLMKRMKPVYLGENLHWLRNDGSIIAFNPETEHAHFIPSTFHQEPETELLFASDDKIKCLTLVSGTKEEISFYTLAMNHKWTLARRIKNISMNESELGFWKLGAYDGKRLVVREKKNGISGVVHVCDMDDISWGKLGSIKLGITNHKDFWKFTPSFLSNVEDEENEQTKVMVASNDRRIPCLEAVMELTDTTE